MKETVKILNLKQAVFYISNGVQPVRVEVGYRDKLVFVFPVEETQQLYSEWIHKCYEVKNKAN